MKVLFLTVSTEIAASSRTRVYQYIPFLQEKGIDYKIIPLIPERHYLAQMDPTKRRYLHNRVNSALDQGKALLRLFGATLLIPKYDVVFIQKVLLPISLQNVIKLLNENIAYDFDDAIYTSPPVVDSDSKSEDKRSRQLAHMLSISKCVILENKYTRKYASKYNQNIVMITGPIDTKRYYPQSKSPSERVVIGWIGSPPNTAYLEPLHDLFRSLCRKYPDLVIELIGASPIDVEGANIVVKQWDLNTEVANLQSFDIGIMPLRDDDWSRGKGGYKLLQYMAIGIACVASSVGINMEMIQEGVNGFLARTESGWEEKLSILIEDEGLRRKMGIAGRQIAVTRYSFQVSAPTFIKALRGVTIY